MDLFEAERTRSEFDPVLRIGTCGYSFQDWRGVFYPPEMPNKKMLDLYVHHFNTVEINSTYYGIPRPSVMAGMVAKAPTEFDFMVKVPASFTHKREEISKDLDQFLQAIAPMQAVGRLSGVLAQFAFAFRFGENELDYLTILRETVSPVPLYVEFRHDSWINRTMYHRLQRDSIGYVSVDEPTLPGLVPAHAFATTKVAYVRLHGRNAEQWWNGGAFRYDYNYSEAELTAWGEKVARLSSKVDTTYVFFNNCHQGHAVLNARDFRRIVRALKNRPS